MSRTTPRVAVVYAAPPPAVGAPQLSAARAVVASLRLSGFKAWTTDAGRPLPRLVRTLNRRRPDVAFNLVSSLGDEARGGTHVAAVLDALGIPAVGGGILTRAACFNYFTFAVVTRGCGLATFGPGAPSEGELLRVPILALPDPLPLDAGLSAAEAALVISAFRALAARDWGECHLLRDPAGEARLIGFEPAPDPSPGGLMGGAFRAIGTDYAATIAALAIQAWRRGITLDPAPGASCVT